MIIFLLLHLFFFNDTATTEIYTLSLHDALPICRLVAPTGIVQAAAPAAISELVLNQLDEDCPELEVALRFAKPWRDRKSTRLNSSHMSISYAVFCLKKKKKKIIN